MRIKEEKNFFNAKKIKRVWNEKRMNVFVVERSKLKKNYVDRVKINYAKSALKNIIYFGNVENKILTFVNNVK